MKNYKFRGIVMNDGFCAGGDVQIGDWVYGSLIVADNGDCLISSWKRTEGYGYMTTSYQVYPESVGQFTGLRDNKETEEFPNGEEIYEGDLFEYHGTLRKVVYREDNASWMGIVEKGSVDSCNFYLRDIIDSYNGNLKSEIIGNIYK